MTWMKNKLKQAGTGVDRRYRGIPYLWISVDVLRNGCDTKTPEGELWRHINAKFLKYQLKFPATRLGMNDVPHDFMLGLMKKASELLENSGVKVPKLF